MRTVIEPVVPSVKEMGVANKASRQMASLLGTAKEVSLQLQTGSQSPEPIVVPLAAMHLLVQSLIEMAKGNAVTLIPVHAELSTQEAADLLTVSRPFLVQLLDEGKMPSRRVGSHRRVLLIDLLAYKKLSDREREKTLEALAADAQDLNMGY